jgi:hypothetical protein
LLIYIYQSLKGQSKFIFGQYVVESKSLIVLTFKTIKEWNKQRVDLIFYGDIEWKSRILEILNLEECKMLPIVSEESYKKLLENNIISKK